MDKCSFFIKNTALFGTYPIQKSVDELEECGVRYFINLTYNYESKIVPYKTQYDYIQYSIKDREIPRNHKSFTKFLYKVSCIIRNLKPNTYIYLHCRGGHGRSGIVVASIFSYMFNMNPSHSIELTSYFHSKRPIMRECWRKLGSPQTKLQKSFVYDFFSYFKVNMTNKHILISDISYHPIVTENGEYYNTVYDAYNALNTTKYVDRFLLETLHILKFKTHKDARDQLLATGIRKLICYSNGSYEYNMITQKILIGIRQYYIENFN